MPTLRRPQFVQELSGKVIDRSAAAQDPRLAGVRLDRADADGDGLIRGAGELSRLFTELDKFDVNGSSNSVDTAQVATQLAALREAAVTPASGMPLDPALRAAFPAGIPAGTSFGASAGTKRLRALQYTLGRLELYSARADGLWGPRTRGAIEAFQGGQGLPITGLVDRATLSALDTEVKSRDLRVPAARVADPLAYLSDFASLPLSTLVVEDPVRPIGWSHPEIRAAYGQFVGEYWEVMKANRVEGDCKTISLFFMDQFRSKLLEDTGIQLPRSRSSRGTITPSTWVAATAAKTLGFFSRTESLPLVRPGYSTAIEVEKLDPGHSMIYGVNVRYAGATAHSVSRATEIIAGLEPAIDNHGDRAVPELPIDLMQPGDLVFMNHTGDGTYDHAVNVVKVARDAAGKVTELVLAVGSFDDMQDADATTPPLGLATVNNYSEEVRVRFTAAGRISSSEVTWSSEPAYISPRRYSAQNTLMELKPGGTLFLARWS